MIHISINMTEPYIKKGLTRRDHLRPASLGPLRATQSRRRVRRHHAEPRADCDTAAKVLCRGLSLVPRHSIRARCPGCPTLIHRPNPLSAARSQDRLASLYAGVDSVGLSPNAPAATMVPASAGGDAAMICWLSRGGIVRWGREPVSVWRGGSAAAWCARPCGGNCPAVRWKPAQACGARTTPWSTKLAYRTRRERARATGGRRVRRGACGGARAAGRGLSRSCGSKWAGVSGVTSRTACGLTPIVVVDVKARPSRKRQIDQKNRPTYR